MMSCEQQTKIWKSNHGKECIVNYITQRIHYLSDHTLDINVTFDDLGDTFASELRGVFRMYSKRCDQLNHEVFELAEKYARIILSEELHYRKFKDVVENGVNLKPLDLPETDSDSIRGECDNNMVGMMNIGTPGLKDTINKMYNSSLL